MAAMKTVAVSWALTPRGQALVAKHRRGKRGEVRLKLARSLAHDEHRRGFVKPWDRLTPEVQANYLRLSSIAMRSLSRHLRGLN